MGKGSKEKNSARIKPQMKGLETGRSGGRWEEKRDLGGEMYVCVCVMERERRRGKERAEA